MSPAFIVKEIQFHHLGQPGAWISIIYMAGKSADVGILNWIAADRRFTAAENFAPKFLAALSEEDRAAVVAAMITATGERA